MRRWFLPLLALWVGMPLSGEASGAARLLNEVFYGPDAPAIAVDLDRLSCDDLYRMRTELLRRTYHYVPPYLDDPRNVAAIAVGTIVTPAFYYLPYTAVQGYLRGRQAVAVDAELSALRQASATKDCFSR
jgi:hypothetical protein